VEFDSENVSAHRVGYEFTNTPPPAEAEVRGFLPSSTALAVPAVQLTFFQQLLNVPPVIHVVATNTNRTVWLQDLQLAASPLKVPIDNLVWGDPVFESLPWQSQNSIQFPIAIDATTGPVVFTFLASQLKGGPYGYVRYRSSAISSVAPSDSLDAGSMQIPSL
jgi:hypothetical protein